MVEFLIQNGSDVGHWDDSGNTALTVAGNFIFSCNTLIISGIFSIKCFMVELFLSATEKVAEILIRNGANVNSANYSGWTVLHSAVNRGEFKTFRINRVKTTWKNLFFAGRKKITELLWRSGAFVNAVDMYGETPLHWTIVNGAALNSQMKNVSII